MFIQGNLQAVFDALYSVGAIDPVLKMDWTEVSEQMISRFEEVNQAFGEINSCHGDMNLMIEKLSGFDSKIINYIAVEVAREFAEFTDRKELH